MNTLEAACLLDRLLTANNETINDLLDQALTVARMVNPNSDNNIQRGPLETILRDNKHLVGRIIRLETALYSLENKQNYTSSADNMSATTYNISSTLYPSFDNLTYTMDNIVLSDICNDININLNDTNSNK